MPAPQVLVENFKWQYSPLTEVEQAEFQHILRQSYPLIPPEEDNEKSRRRGDELLSKALAQIKAVTDQAPDPEFVGTVNDVTDLLRKTIGLINRRVGFKDHLTDQDEDTRDYAILHREELVVLARYGAGRYIYKKIDDQAKKHAEKEGLLQDEIKKLKQEKHEGQKELTRTERLLKKERGLFEEHQKTTTTLTRFQDNEANRLKEQIAELKEELAKMRREKRQATKVKKTSAEQNREI